MGSNPSIIYWKWDDSIFEPGVMESKVEDLLSRSDFEMIFIGTHWLSCSVMDPQLVEKIDDCCSLLHSRGRQLMLEMEARNEYAKFIQRHPDDLLFSFYFREAVLDEQGAATIVLDSPQAFHYHQSSGVLGIERILGSWCFDLVDGEIDSTSLQDLQERTSFRVEEKTTTITIQGGKENANKRVLVIPAFRQAIPNLFSPNLYPFYNDIFAHYAHVPLNGVAVDEWGIDVMIGLENGEIRCECLTYGDELAQDYLELTGRPLAEELLLLKYFIKDQKTRSYRAVNDYVRVLRAKMVENETWFYHKGKEVFGPETFIGVHATWWGACTELFLEVLKNGIDWWEVPRDYAQTDETVIYPIRLALARKWDSPVWYNMWYSMGTRRLDTYFAETWRNVRYGGRTHYLGYECPNEDVVLELNQPGMLEQIREMEKEIGKLDSFIQSTPDSRILVVFGIEAVSNWMLNEPNWESFTTKSLRLEQSLKITQELLAAGYLCDLVPSSEIATGQVRLVEGKLTYGSDHHYDALLFLFPEFCPKSVWEFIQHYHTTGGKLLGVGDLTYLREMEKVAEDFRHWSATVPTWLEEVTGTQPLVEVLDQWELPKHASENGCVFKDGSVLFTADAKENLGNELVVNTTIGGQFVEFKGSDYLALRFSKDGQLEKVICGHPSEFLRINGEDVEVS